MDPVPDDAPGVLVGLEGVLPDTLLFEAPKESFNDAILLGGIGYDELLLQSMISAGLPRLLTLKDQAIVAAQHRGACESEHAEPCETGRLKGPFRFLRSAAQRELVTTIFRS